LCIETVCGKIKNMFQGLETNLMVEGGAFWTLVAIELWELPWKGIALWKAARNRHMGWFVTLMLVHLAGLIDIIYIFYFSEIKKGAISRVRKAAKDEK
jgi:hypothetical protein